MKTTEYLDQGRRLNEMILFQTERLKELRAAADSVGAMKPSPRYFEAIFRESGETDLSRTLMVGDNPVTDVNGAVDFGMTGVLFGARWQEPSKARWAVPTMSRLEELLFDEE